MGGAWPWAFFLFFSFLKRYFLKTFKLFCVLHPTQIPIGFNPHVINNKATFASKVTTGYK